MTDPPFGGGLAGWNVGAMLASARLPAVARRPEDELMGIVAERTRPITPEEVLEILRAEHRYWCGNDEGDPSVKLTFDTSVRDWSLFALMNDEMEWRLIASRRNAVFGIRGTATEWRAALHPWGKKTLRGICELVARRARVPVIEPATVLGARCQAAGAFRWLERRFGANLDDGRRLRPSSPLDEFLRGRYTDIVYDLILVAPERLPPVRVTSFALNRSNFARFVWLFGMAGFCMLSCLPVFGLLVMALSIVFLLCLGVLRVISPPPADRIECGSLRTVGDLCYVLVGQKPKRRAFKTELSGPDC